MTLAPGMRIGAYEIVSLLGEGGMGAVYRARDSKLKREVAIKVLPANVAADGDRLARFQREAEVLAALNHPHIAGIYGLEDAGGTIALVMELVEGEDLSQRIARGAIPLDEALPIARQIAEALEAAHEQGIVHRDLKPANIKVRPDGTVKVLDFGLAKAIEQAPGSGLRAPGGASIAATITSPAMMTGVGVILGTAAYMAPEQAKGRAVDKRADIWAFGCVLFEMLTGQCAFDGEDVADVLSRVLQREPDLAVLPAAVPVHVRTLVARCLVKDPRQRLRDIGDARLALDGAFDAPASGDAARDALAAPVVSSRGTRVAWGLAAAAVFGMAVLAVPAVRHVVETAPPQPPSIRADIVTPASEEPTSFALSPDGTQIVYVASVDGVSRLWLRALAGTTAQPLDSTEGARAPFWSPDGHSIGFFAGNALKRTDIGGARPRELARVIVGQGGSWNADGTIVFAPAVMGSLLRLPAAGGAAAPATTLAEGQAGHILPWCLPDGRRFLYYAVGKSDVAGLYVGNLDSAQSATRLAAADGPATYVADTARGGGWLVWTQAQTLLAQRFDVDTAVLTGEPMEVADRVGGVTAATTGLLAYRPVATVRRQLTWVDRNGVQRGTVGAVVGGGNPNAPDGAARLSPDGTRLLVGRSVQGQTDLWVVDGARETRLTFNGVRGGVWAPDGRRVVFTSGHTGAPVLFQKLASGAGTEEPILTTPGVIAAFPTSWSPDGRFVLYFSGTGNGAGGTGLWLLPMTDGRAGTPVPFLKTSANTVFGRFSPDGRWVAYQSDESGESEVYVRPFVWPVPPDGADQGRWQVSTGGGIRPIWSHDAKELYFLDPAGRVMAATMTVRGSALEPGAPTALFAGRVFGGGVERQQATGYDVAPDGRFLIDRDLGVEAGPITLLMNPRLPEP